MDGIIRAAAGVHNQERVHRFVRHVVDAIRSGSFFAVNTADTEHGCLCLQLLLLSWRHSQTKRLLREDPSWQLSVSSSISLVSKQLLFQSLLLFFRGLMIDVLHVPLLLVPAPAVPATPLSTLARCR